MRVLRLAGKSWIRDPKTTKETTIVPWRGQMCGLSNYQPFGRLPSATSESRSDPLITPVNYPNPLSHAAVAVGRHLFPIFALALDLPENFFDDKVSYILTFSHRPTPSPSKSLPWIAKTLCADKPTTSFIMALLD